MKVFFSHSSKDKAILTRLKTVVNQKVDTSIEIFLSSDGQSISLGRNWVSELEKALKEAKIMFVFLTPNSVKSDWVFFESGYAYSLGIKVIPVGILGINLEMTSPPISLLQGFNLNSLATLNNILAEIEKESKKKLTGSFSEEEYNLIFKGTYHKITPNLSETVESIFIEPFNQSTTSGLIANTSLYNDLRTYLNSNFKNHGFSKNVYNVKGIDISTNPRETNSSLRIRLTIDPEIIYEQFAIIHDIINLSFENPPSSIRLTIKLFQKFNAITETTKLSARLYDYGFKFLQNGDDFLEYEGVTFVFSNNNKRNYFIFFEIPLEQESILKLDRIIQIFQETEIITTKL